MTSIGSSSHVPRLKPLSMPRTRPPTNSMNTTSIDKITSPARTANTGPYNTDFAQNLIDGGVFPHNYEYPDGRLPPGLPPEPVNMDDIRQRLAQPRPSLTPSKFLDEDFKTFKRTHNHAEKEKQVTSSVIPIIEGDINHNYASGGIPFTNLDALTDGTLVPGNPDKYYGARPEQLDPGVRAELDGYIIPSTQKDLPITPNFFLEVKGLDGSMTVVDRQATYNIGLGVRCMHSLRSYRQEEPVLDNNAYSITSTYHSGLLGMYTGYCSQPAGPGSRPVYHMHQIKGWDMTGDIESFREGATFYRNGLAWAEEQRNEAIRQANERQRECRSKTPAI